MFVNNMGKAITFMFNWISYFSPHDINISYNGMAECTCTFPILYFSEKLNGFLGSPLKLSVDWSKLALF